MKKSKDIDLLALKNKFFAWKYGDEIENLLKKVAWGEDDFDDPICLEPEHYHTKGEHRYLDLRVPYSRLSEPRNDEELLLIRRRYWIERLEKLYGNDVKMLTSYMNISEEELMNIIETIKEE